jgi:uncharacterized protein
MRLIQGSRIQWGRRGSKSLAAIDYKKLWARVSQQFQGDPHSVHGPSHWRRVERNGLLLATQTGAKIEVVKLFALFHDSKRENEMTDHGHGMRGAEFAKEMRGEWYDIADEEFQLLYDACVGHTDQHHSDNPTIGTCWDADRLDLGRVGIIPDPEFMSTTFGKEIARMGSIQPFLATD